MASASRALTEALVLVSVARDGDLRYRAAAKLANASLPQAANGRFVAVILEPSVPGVGRVGTVVGISVQIGDYPMERLAGRVDTLREWLLVRLP